jgi:uncharacterized protein
MRILLFYAVAFTFSWMIWLAGILFGISESIPELLISVGGLGPVLAVVVTIFFLYDRETRLDLLNRLIRVRKVGFLIWSVIILLPPAVHMVATVVSGIVIGDPVPFPEIFTISPKFVEKGSFYVGFLLVFGPVPEEIAWRGIGLHELHTRTDWGFLRVQGVVGILWAVWHVPLFFIPGSYQASLGVFTPRFWMFFGNIIFLSFLIGWSYLRSGGSVPAAIIFHYTVNLTGEMFDLELPGELIRLTLMGILGATVLFVEESRRKTIIKRRTTLTEKRW